jgi:hypothetical protein
MLCVAQFESDEPSFAALWAEGEVDTGKILHHLLPCFAHFGNIGFGMDLTGYGLLVNNKSPCALKLCLGIARGHEAEVSDFDKPGRKNVQEKPADELLSMDSDESVLFGVVVVPGPECDQMVLKA